ncbi:MAG: dipeptidase [Polyangiaceae bacterium]|nr:dipeptidase [Polyangiaceae bacterium]
MRALSSWLLLLAFAAACGDRSATPSSSAASSSAATTASSSATGGPAPATSASGSAPDATAVAEAPPKPDDPPRAIDMHVDTPWQVKYKDRPVSLPEGHATMAKLKTGQYGGIVYPIYIPDYLHDSHPTIRDAEEIFDTVESIISEHGDVLHAYTKGPTPPGKVTAYVSIEGAGCFADDISQIDRFIKRGVIFIGPVHWHDSALSTSATGKDKKKRGLTEQGKAFAERVYKNGGIVDVSHMSDRGFADLVPIAERYGAPIVATHSNSRAVADHPRNLTDEQLRIIAKTGGVAGLNFYEKFVREGGGATVDDLAKHALHMIEVAGVDHVGIGSDFDGGTPAKGLEDASKVPALAKALRKAGVSAEDVHKIFSENVKRVIRSREKQRAAASAGGSER